MMGKKYWQDRHRRTAAVIVAGFSLLGGIAWLAAGSAATFAVSSEAESGQAAGTAVAGSSNGASGGNAVRFGGGDNGDILFEDDFNGPAGSLPDQSKWGEYCPGSVMAGSWGGIRCGADETLDGSGSLILPATPQYGTGLITKYAHRIQYGTFSAWMKMPAQVGYWPAFWLINPANSNGTGDGGEIDIVEHYTTWPMNYHDTVHAWKGDGGSYWHGPDDNNAVNVNLSQGFHKYSARVEPGKISMFFDDRPVGTVVSKLNAAYTPWLFGPDNAAKHYIILDLALGGAGGQQQPATQPAQMFVDRVEIRRL